MSSRVEIEEGPMTAPARTLHRHACILLAAAVGLASAACGDNLHPEKLDGGTVAIDAPFHECGNGTVEPGEECDDGDTIADMVCDATCHFTCGNGVVDDALGELCDTGIASGDGACPTSCDDGDACTSDVASGTACQASCEHAPITALVTGDGCCPAGATLATDGDCSPVCGNGVVEPGETCDTGIASGAGACPTEASCNDGFTCTGDSLAMGGTCQAVCHHDPITLPANGDGCCPAGATPATDDDCVPGCGNGVVDPGETCDTGIFAGPGRCVTACNDGMACTSDVVVNGGTCTAACSFPAITLPANGDGCCPMDANHNNDNDCAPVCGNGVREGAEGCDDGNVMNFDGCSATCTPEPTAFRMSDLDLRDPHVWVNALGCRDVTDAPFLGFSVNGSLQTAIQTDGSTPPDGLLDLSLVNVFRPLIQFNNNITTLDLHGDARCTSPLASTMCMNGAGPGTAVISTSFTASTCLSPMAGTTRPYTPAITTATAPCYVSNALTLTISLGGIPVTLRDAHLAATWVGNPAQNTVNGLLAGFLSETDANNTTIPATFPLIGGQPVSSVLPGGTGSCAPGDDRDMDGNVRGWWFYFNYSAPRVPWTSP
ncbi:MAG TPA: DUF4215 domain-containing protein [Kofleriaceae bacterium]|nr:DUF4215 domain-containing protein [Kofleriaceae bacterium]